MKTFTHTPIPTDTDPNALDRFVYNEEGILVDTQIHERTLEAQEAWEKKRLKKKKEQ
jgi:hypothetical protein